MGSLRCVEHLSASRMVSCFVISVGICMRACLCAGYTARSLGALAEKSELGARWLNARRSVFLNTAAACSIQLHMFAFEDC